MKRKAGPLPLRLCAPSGVGGFNSRGEVPGGRPREAPTPAWPQKPALCSEFMVEERELQKEKIQEDYNDKYWDRRYTVVQRQIPSFLQKMAGKVLSTGAHGRPGGRACVRRAGPGRAVHTRTLGLASFCP